MFRNPPPKGREGRRHQGVRADPRPQPAPCPHSPIHQARLPCRLSPRLLSRHPAGYSSLAAAGTLLRLLFPAKSQDFTKGSERASVPYGTNSGLICPLEKREKNNPQAPSNSSKSSTGGTGKVVPGTSPEHCQLFSSMPYQPCKVATPHGQEGVPHPKIQPQPAPAALARTTSGCRQQGEGGGGKGGDRH